MRVPTLLRTAFGLLLIFHGLAQAVLPLRGFGPPIPPETDWGPVVLYSVAMIGFVWAGLGVLGARPMDRQISEAMVLASSFSLAAILRLGHADLGLGTALDIVFFVIGVWRGYAGWFPREPVKGLGRTAITVVGTAILLYVAIAALTWPQHRTWGTTDDERRMALPGDRVDRNMRLEIQHAVTIHASPAEIWPWLVQIGQDRGGFYSYDWLERLFGADIHNVREIRPEWQQRRAGDFVRATQPAYLGGIFGDDLGWTITTLEPERAMVLDKWGAFVLVPAADQDGTTRLIVRSTISNARIPAWAAALEFSLFELPHFIMERRMLLNIKALAEQHGIANRRASTD